MFFIDNSIQQLIKQKMADMRQRKPHAIMISVPYQGHINPFVNLALKLASMGVAVTFVHLEFVHHKLSKAHLSNTNTEVDLFSEARESGHDIRYTTISDGWPLEFDRQLHAEEHWRTIFRDLPPADDFVGKIIHSDKNLVPFLVADTIYAWPRTIAEKYNLVYVSFWTQPALVFNLSYHLDLLKQKGHLPCKDDVEEEINYVPGVESINTRDLMSFLKESGLADVSHEVISLSFQQVKKADFILHNTVVELESEIISALNKYQQNYAVGPLGFPKNHAAVPVSNSLWSESDCDSWLGSKSTGSVLYVSFGSSVSISKKLFEEIAYGLVLSEVNFIWVVRAGIVTPGDDTDIFLDGYEDKIKDKGLIVSWCDQIKVLSNPAVGGFLTHNGWNSTVESMWCGVPMICCPLMWDQFTNRKLVVDDWKIGINLCDGESVDRKEVAEKIRSFMRGDTSMSLKQEMEKVKAIMHKAVEIGGSSERNFNQFVNDLKAKIWAKTTSGNIND